MYTISAKISERLHHFISEFIPVNDRQTTIHIRLKFYNNNLIWAHVPMEDKDDKVKDAFYVKLEEIYDNCMTQDAKIVIGVLNPIMMQESILALL